MNDIAYSTNSPRVRKYAAYKRKEHNNAVRNFKKNCDYRRWMVGLKECNKMKTKEIYKKTAGNYSIKKGPKALQR